MNPLPTTNDVSKEPSVFNRTILFINVPLYAVNWPPTIIFPSVCIDVDVTPELNPVPTTNDVSKEPSVFNLTILFIDVPLYDVKFPPTSIFPSDWIENDRTLSLNPVPTTNDVSKEPSVFNLTILFIDVPLYDVNAPPTNIFPSDCNITSVIPELNPVPIVNDVSKLPSVFNLAI